MKKIYMFFTFLLMLTFFDLAKVNATDFPPNPVEKEGHIIDFQEEFNDSELDLDKWLPYYFPHWVSEEDREKAKARYRIEDGKLIERIDKDTPAWNPDYDSTVRISSITTYNRDWLHRFNYAMPNNHHEPTFDGYSTKYGYFEMRAKLSDVGGGGHQAWWLVGTQEDDVELTGNTQQNAEIDILETFFRYKDTWRIAAYGWNDPNFTSSWVSFQDPVPHGEPTEEFHTYAVDWRPDGLRFYYDNELYKVINDAPDTDMGMILGIYTDAGSGQSNGVYPKEWEVDYIRVWKDSDGYDYIEKQSEYINFKNRQTAEYLFADDGTGSALYGHILPTEEKAQWEKISVDNEYVKYKNQHTETYLCGGPQAKVIMCDGDSDNAQWKETDFDGYKRLLNKVNNHVVHTEDRLGYVQYDDQPLQTWWTSHWSINKVSNYVSVKNITISPENNSLKVGESQQLTLTAHLADGSSEMIDGDWKVENSDIASVDKDGMLTALSEGTTTVTVVWKGKTAQVTINVKSEQQTERDISYLISILNNNQEELVEKDYRSLTVHLAAVGQFEKKGEATKIIKHMEGFNQLLEHQLKTNSIPKDLYDVLKVEADLIIGKYK